MLDVKAHMAIVKSAVDNSSIISDAGLNNSQNELRYFYGTVVVSIQQGCWNVVCFGLILKNNNGIVSMPEMLDQCKKTIHSCIEMIYS